MQLSEITTLVKSNYELTRRVLDQLERGQRAELTGLVRTIDVAIGRARELKSVPVSLWEGVAGKDAQLRGQRDLYQDKVAPTYAGSVQRTAAAGATTCS